MANRQVEYPSRLQCAMLGDVLAVAKKDEGDSEVVVLGTIIGYARGLSYRTNTQDPTTPAIALIGYFEGIPADPEMPLFKCNALFLPRTVHDAVVAAVRGEGSASPPQMPKRGQKFDVVGTEVPIAFEISAKKSKVAGGAGYEFITRSMKEIAGADPLATLRAELGMKALPAPATATPTAASAPVKEKVKVKAKAKAK